MAETFHRQMLEHLAVEQRRVNSGVNAVHEIILNGDKYLKSERDKLVAVARFACGKRNCTVCAGYRGNEQPES